MLSLDTFIFFVILSFVASMVNGGLGYGYSSISVPIALLVETNKILNPAYALLEALINTIMLGLAGKKHILATFKRVLPIAVMVIPGVAVGSLGLSLIPSSTLKLVVYAILLPLILLQASGIRKPIKKEKRAGLALGFGIGTLYSLTTISGPPIALFWNNQGMIKEEFKAALAQIRVVESYMTLASYFLLGIISVQSLDIFTAIAPPVLIGLPLGMLLAKNIKPETFRRVCMSFDGWVVAYALSSLLISQLHVAANMAYAFLALVFVVDGVLLYRFFTGRQKMDTFSAH